jgi:hypothetical protein
LSFFQPAYEQIVIGSDINALTYAYTNALPLIFNSDKKPKFFERAELGVDLSIFNVSNNLKLDLWKRLCFSMSLAGLLPIPRAASSLRVEGDILKVFVSKSKMVKFKFSQLVVFDDENMAGLDIYSSEDKYKVYDWINVRSGGKHELEHLTFDDDFVKEVYFYPSKRIDGNHENKKDFVAISYLTKEELNDINYSDTYVRFKVKKIMEDHGVKGKRNGRNPTYPDRSTEPYRFLSIKLESADREVIRVKKKGSKNIAENIILINKTFKEICEEFEDFDDNLAHTLNWKL